MPADATPSTPEPAIARSPAGGSVVVLAGGVGGARLARGLQAHLGDRLTVIVNTGDDVELHGLAIWPDHDTVLYTLAGVEDPDQGWGIRGESWTTMAALEALGEAPWFRLGDRDLATHLARTGRLAAGERPTEVAARLRAALGVPATILPMTDDLVRTRVRTDAGWLDFQDYFVRLRQAPDVREVRFDGIDAAVPSPEVEAAIAAASTVVVAPSNPIVSIGPILALPGVRDAIAGRRAAGVPVAAVSPLVAGRALKGPADRMLASLGHEPSALGVARILADVASSFVLDRADADLAPAVEGLGLRPIVTDSIMADDAGRARLAGTILDALAARPSRAPG